MPLLVGLKSYQKVHPHLAKILELTPGTLLIKSEPALRTRRTKLAPNPFLKIRSQFSY